MSEVGVRLRKVLQHLSDGREIIYFDEGIRSSHADDTRRPFSVTSASVLRYDPILDELVCVASHRQDRTHLPPEAQCPLCPSTAGRQTEIPSSDYDVVVFENRFPSFSAPAGAIGADGRFAGGAFRERSGDGRCEIVCFTSDHDTSFSQLSPERVRTILEAWVDRTVALSALPYVEQVFCFENRGEEIGVTLSHPHGQIYAYPFIAPRLERMLATARAYRQRTSRNVFADTLTAELENGARVVTRGAQWSAFVPFAARWPLEVHLYPHRQVASLPDLNDEERQEFCAIYLDVLGRMEAAYGPHLPYIAGWYQAPVRTDRDLSYLHLQLVSVRRAPGKLKYLAGSESAMGAFINDVLPEQTARTLRGIRP